MSDDRNLYGILEIVNDELTDMGLYTLKCTCDGHGTYRLYEVHESDVLGHRLACLSGSRIEIMRFLSGMHAGLIEGYTKGYMKDGGAHR